MDSNNNNNKDQIIDRLISENSNLSKMIAEAKNLLSQFEDIEGLPFNSAIKILVKNYKQLLNNNKNLNKELEKYTKEKHVYAKN